MTLTEIYDPLTLFFCVKVFLYVYGTENNWTSIGLQTRSNANFDGFPSGSIRTFCLKGPEIGQLHHLNVNVN